MTEAEVHETKDFCLANHEYFYNNTNNGQILLAKILFGFLRQRIAKRRQRKQGLNDIKKVLNGWAFFSFFLN